MPRYAVYSDTYTVGGGFNVAVAVDPPEPTCDWVEVDAPNARRAKVLGLRAMRAERNGYYGARFEEHYEDRHPFACLHVLNLDLLPEE